MSARLSLYLIVVGCLMLLMASLALGANLAVTSVSDSGAGSLREAIEVANANAGSSITFDPSLTGRTIVLQSDLPALTAGSTSIEGDTNSDYEPDIIIDSAGVATVGLYLASSGNKVQRLSFRRSSTYGILVTSGGVTTGGNLVEGCHVSECARGITSNHCSVTVLGNQISACPSSIVITGGTAIIDTNEISGGTSEGIRVSGGCQAQIGGNQVIDCPGVAITAQDAGTTAEIRANEVGNCGDTAIYVCHATGAIYNNNLYSPHRVGIALAGDGTSASITGNYIENAGADGVLVSDHARTDEVRDNEITGCGQSGIRFASAASAFTIMQNGVHGNTGDGMRFSQGSTAEVTENQIHENGGSGVAVLDDATRVRISMNAIYDNGGLGIDLGGDGVTPNGPSGTGPNKLIGYPVVTGVETQEGWESQVWVYGVAPIGANISVYSAAPDPSGYGEGRTLLDWVAEGDGSGGFSVMVQKSDLPITMTATDADGNTSEFSLWRWPVAQAGPDQTVETTSAEGAEVTLDGSGSSSPDGGALDYLWTWTAADGSHQRASGVSPTVLMAPGQAEVTLKVSDGHGASTFDTVVISVNGPPIPVANAGPDQTVEAPSSQGAQITLDGSRSTSPDGGTLDYLWTWTAADGSQQQATGVNPTVSMPLGQAEVALTVTDGHGASSVDTVTIIVIASGTAADPVQWRTENGGNGHWYQAVASESMITCDQAKAAAQAAGGYLATLTTAQENAFVWALVDFRTHPELWGAYLPGVPGPITGPCFGPWLGGYQDPYGFPANANWHWPTGEPWGYTNWHAGQPDHWTGTTGQDRETCLMFYGDGGTWNDMDHLGNPAETVMRGYVIEYNTWPVGGNQDPDADSVPASVEDAAPNNGDGNGDGVPDSQQANVASLPDSADGQYVTLESAPGTRLAKVAATANPSPGDVPPGAAFPAGFLQYELVSIDPGAASTVTLHLSTDHRVSTYYKYGSTLENATSHWYEFAYDGTTGAEIQGNRVILHFVDGQRGDSDLLPNGVIADPGGPVAILGPVIFATNSIHLEQNSKVHSGDVIANVSSQGPYLDSGVELSVGIGTDVAASSGLYSDSIMVKMNADVYGDVHENELANNGRLHGQTVTPLKLPVLPGSPAFRVASPGTSDVIVAQNATITLPPGAYRDVLVRKGGKVTFTGGTYHLRSLNTGDNVCLEFATPSVVRIADKFDSDLSNYIGPATGSSVTAAQIVFYVAGINGSNGTLDATPKAAQIGIGNTLLANFFVPNGTLWLRQNSVCTGAFVGRDVDLGVGAEVTCDSAFSIVDYQTPAGSADAGARTGSTVQVTSACAVATSAGAQITFTLSTEASVSVEVINITGRLIRRVYTDEPGTAGVNTVLWDRRSATGTKVPCGRYLVHLTARSADGHQSAVMTSLMLRR